MSLSLSVMLGNKDTGIITSAVQSLAVCAWWALASSIVLALVLKTLLIFQAFMLQVATDWLNRNVARLNAAGWLLGISTLFAFSFGLVQIVRAAVIAIGA